MHIRSQIKIGPLVVSPTALPYSSTRSRQEAPENRWGTFLYGRSDTLGRVLGDCACAFGNGARLRIRRVLFVLSRKLGLSRAPVELQVSAPSIVPVG